MNDAHSPPPSLAFAPGWKPGAPPDRRTPTGRRTLTPAQLAALDYPPDRCSVLIADDGSTDATPQILADFVRDRPTWRILRIQGQMGEARGKGNALAHLIAATDAEAFLGFKNLSELEGIIPALETSHAIFGAMELAKTMKEDENIVICLSGRGDKDVQSVAEELPVIGPKIGWDLRF